MRDDTKVGLWMIAAVMVVCVVLVAFKSWQEAKAFNRLTGGNATTWDAMFVQLRVTEGGQ